MDEMTKFTNQSFLDQLTSDDSSLEKRAQDGLNDYTRSRVREVGFLREILPPLPITDDEIDREVDTDKPVKHIDKEPESPAAVTVPFATNPVRRYISGPRYTVAFARMMSPEFTKDVIELKTYEMDIRQVISDNSIKDIHTEEDTKWIDACNAVMVGADQTVPETNAVHWKTTSEPVTRDSLAESQKIMPRIGRGIEPYCGLINHITIRDILKFGRDEAGGDISQQMFVDGFTMEKVQGIYYKVTIKSEIVPEDTLFYFAEPKFLGKFLILDDLTMFVDKRAWWIQFFAYEAIGAAIGNVAGVARQDFNVAT